MLDRTWVFINSCSDASPCTEKIRAENLQQFRLPAPHWKPASKAVISHLPQEPHRDSFHYKQLLLGAGQWPHDPQNTPPLAEGKVWSNETPNPWEP